MHDYRSRKWVAFLLLEAVLTVFAATKIITGDQWITASQIFAGMYIVGNVAAKFTPTPGGQK